MEQIQRVLAPHQTVQERNVCQRVASTVPDPVWVRTCYSADLEEAHEEMIGEAVGDEQRLLLENRALYNNASPDLSEIFLRVPMLPDAGPYDGNPALDHPPLTMEQPENEARIPLWQAARKSMSVVYLLDEEALNEHLIKLLWLDIHGNVVWRNKVAPEYVETFQSRSSVGKMLFWHFSRFEDYPDILETSGSTLEYDE